MAIVLSVGAGCFHGWGATTEIAHPSAPNPTSYAFDRSLEQVRACVRDDVLVADRWGHTVEIDRYSHRDEDVGADAFAEDVTTEPLDEAHRVSSTTFRYRGCPLTIYGDWRIVARAVSSTRTDVRVERLAISVHNHRCRYVAHPWGCAEDVPMTTIEEYRILNSLGRCLGVTDMPEVIEVDGEPPSPEACAALDEE